jgi:uncharacterized protein DUF5677
MTTKRALIPSPGGAYGNILNRALAEANAEQYLKPHILVLEDMADYGTHLLPRCWLESKRGIRDIVALVVLTKQVLESIDASLELLRRSCVKPCMLTVRSAFEASIYAEFVLRGKDERAAKAYYVSYLRRKRRWANRAIRGTPERKAFLRDLRGMPFKDPFASTSQQRVARAEAARLNAKLNDQRYRKWNARFDRIELKRHAAWYDPLFPRRKHLRDICGILHRRHEYRSIYEVGSEEMHGARMGAHLEVPENGTMLITPLRESSDFPFVVKALSGIAIHTYRKTLEHYRPDEVENFVRKYVADWRPLLRNPIKMAPDKIIERIG